MSNIVEALTTLADAADVMSAESCRAQGRGPGRTYGRRFDAASASYREACFWLQANARQVWDFITSEGHVSSVAARMVLATA